MHKTIDAEEIPQLTNFGKYAVNVGWDYLKEHLQHYENYNLDLNPDFQRGHVWNESQQRSYVEWVLRGGVTGRDIYFNCPGFLKTREKSVGPMVLVDGKQRLQAALKFIDDELTVFHGLKGKEDGWKCSEFTRLLGLSGPSFIVHVNDLRTRKEVLQWYVDYNSGGTIHSDEEINRVKQLIEDENI